MIGTVLCWIGRHDWQDWPPPSCGKYCTRCTQWNPPKPKEIDMTCFYEVGGNRGAAPRWPKCLRRPAKWRTACMIQIRC